MSEYRDRAVGFEKGNAGERPECCTEEHLKYLDVLRASGITNMFGARPYLMNAFRKLSEEQAAGVLGYWMESFGERHPS